MEKCYCYVQRDHAEFELTMDGKFDSEAKLVSFGRKEINQLTKHIGVKVNVKSEVKAAGCIPDLVVYLKNSRKLCYVVTIEFKLSNWKKALAQAFVQRNVCNESYVILDYETSASARANIDQFEKSNVGLATLDKEFGLRVWSYPKPSLPFSEYYSEKFSQELLNRKTPPTNLPYTRSTKGGARLKGARLSIYA